MVSFFESCENEIGKKNSLFLLEKTLALKTVNVKTNILVYVDDDKMSKATEK